MLFMPATRKPPPVISSDSDDEEDGAVEGEPAPRPTPSSLKVKDNIPEIDEDEDDNLSDMYQQSDEEEPDNDDNELEGLDPKSLKSMLTGERPQWAVQDADVDDLLSAEGPDVGMDLEVDELDVDQDLDVDGQYSSMPNDEETHLSKRALARRAEVPKWSDVDAQAKATRQSSANSTHAAPSNAISLNDNEDQWPAEAHYVPPQSGSRNISLTAQPPVIYTVIKVAIRRVIGDALFVDAYPSTASFDDYVRSISMDIAEELEYDALYERLEVDTALVEYISRLIETSFGLGGGVSVEDRRDLVKKLLDSGWPHPANKAVPPSDNYIVTSSTIDDGPLSIELEIPAPMLCMVATARTQTYAAIEDWGSGYLKRSEFNSDAYEDVYRGHKLFLENILTNKRRAYHRLMADLYQEAAQSNAGHSATVIANNSMAILDLAGMDDETKGDFSSRSHGQEDITKEGVGVVPMDMEEMLAMKEVIGAALVDMVGVVTVNVLLTMEKVVAGKMLETMEGVVRLWKTIAGRGKGVVGR
ncbi:hypothetical protein D9615_003229 [Tricholomella constricta]|uniref:DUF6532 domain-containing protein n=1 Tax=Tricholomella constricta TaxID=117010 RepID=A0A8H5M844_9AGAR|nr:hypothetical protein D9615_003229 [Tricholomella constricta]